ncbi:MAG: LamG-like jellyroll fold domain-containing protein [Armatimonadota bacterium]
MRLTPTIAAIMAIMPAFGLTQEDALLLRASFDGELAAEYARGDPEPVWAREGTAVVEGGVSGMCAEVPDGANLCFDAPGNAYWERGTLAFWWQCVDPVGTTEFDVATIGAFNHFYYGRWYRLYASGGRLHAYLIDWHHDPKRAPIAAGDFRPQTGQWYHVAMAWDSRRGVGLYVNGRLVAESGVPWYMPTPLNQIGLGVSAVASHARATALRRQRFDELRSYDRWLADEQIVALARGEDVVAGPALDEETIAQHRIASLGLDRPDGLPVVPRDGRALAIRQPGIVTAKDVRRTQLSGVDGKLDTAWPSGRRYAAEGSRYDITLAGEPVNYVAMTATMRGRVQLVADSEATVALTRGRDDPMVVHALLDEPVPADSVHVLREISADPSAAQHDGAMGDLQLLHLSTTRAAPMGSEFRGLVLAQTESLGAMGRTIRDEHLPGDRVTLSPGVAPTAPVSLPAMRTLHIVSEAYDGREIIGPIDLELALDAPPLTVAHIELIHPLNYTRRQLIVDCVLGAGSEPVRFTIVPRSLVLEPGQRLRLVVSFTRPVIIDPSASALHLSRYLHDWVDLPVPGGPAGQYVDDQMRMLKEHFMLLSEARPWGWDPTKIKRLGEMYACLDQLRALAPEDPRVVAYYHWTHPNEAKPLPELAPPDPGVPAWAAYQVRLVEMLRRVPQWWIDNRQVETGEFGSNDGLNDDSVLVQDWLGMYLMCDRDPLLLESARRVAEMCWQRTMTDGWNNQVTDPLHAYEWGMNVTCMMAVMDYGSPVWIERMMAMARHLEELTGMTARGHRHYRSNRYGLGEIVTEGRYGWDTTANALNMQPAALLGWYQGNAEATRYLTEWIDSWCEDLVDPADGRGRACVVEFATEEREPERLASYAFGHMVWAAYDLTGERRYLDLLGTLWESDRRHYDQPQRTMEVAQQILGHLDREDIRADFAAAVAAVDLWTAPIRYTDTRPELKYLQWLMTGKREPVVEALRATLSDLSWELPMWTEAEQSPDRLWLPQALPNMMALGDVSMLRNRTYPLQWVSWSRTGGKLAAWVLDKAPDRLRVWLVNVGDEPMAPVATVWRLAHGIYEVRLGADADEDGQPDAPAETVAVELARGWELSVGELPPRAVMLLEITQTQALEPITQRADLAVCDRDVTIDAQTGAATLTVHNVGGADAGPFTVRVARQDTGAETTYQVPALAASKGLEPSRAIIPLTGLDLTGCVAIGAEIVTDQAEIFTGNNRAVIALPRQAAAVPQGGHPVADG